MAQFRTDQFDNVPDDLDRVGAHRGPKVRGRGWITFAWAALATAILVVAGLYVLSTLNPSIKFPLAGSAPSATPTSTGTPTPTITPVEDPASVADRNITVTVLNGTAEAGLAGKAADKLTAKGWKVIGTSNSDATNIKTTTVYYSSAKDLDVAEGIQGLLGAQNVALSTVYPASPITVVVGSSFTG